MSLDYVKNKDGSAGKRYNPITGCIKDLDICPIWYKCWAKERAETRLRGRFGYDQDDPFKPTFHRNRLKRPMERQKATGYYVGYMGDMFNREVPTEWLEKVYNVIRQTPRHRYLMLSKRPERYLSPYLDPPVENTWWGTSVIRKEDIERSVHIYKLKDRYNARTYWEIEPAVNDLSPSVLEIDECFLPDWVIIGGWSGKDNDDLRKNIAQMSLVLIQKDVKVWHKDNLEYGVLKDNPVWEDQ